MYICEALPIVKGSHEKPLGRDKLSEQWDRRDSVQRLNEWLLADHSRSLAVSALLF